MNKTKNILKAAAISALLFASSSQALAQDVLNGRRGDHDNAIIVGHGEVVVRDARVHNPMRDLIGHHDWDSDGDDRNNFKIVRKCGRHHSRSGSRSGPRNGGIVPPVIPIIGGTAFIENKAYDVEDDEENEEEEPGFIQTDSAEQRRKWKRKGSFSRGRSNSRDRSHSSNDKDRSWSRGRKDKKDRDNSKDGDNDRSNSRDGNDRNERSNSKDSNDHKRHNKFWAKRGHRGHFEPICDRSCEPEVERKKVATHDHHKNEKCRVNIDHDRRKREISTEGIEEKQSIKKFNKREKDFKDDHSVDKLKSRSCDSHKRYFRGAKFPLRRHRDFCD